MAKRKSRKASPSFGQRFLYLFTQNPKDLKPKKKAKSKRKARISTDASKGRKQLPKPGQVRDIWVWDKGWLVVRLVDSLTGKSLSGLAVTAKSSMTANHS